MDKVKYQSLYQKATDQTSKFVERVKDFDLDKQSNCSEWSVRQLLNHIVSENLWMPELLIGKTIAEVGNQYDGDVLGEDPKAAFEQALAEANSALSADNVLDGVVHVSWGDIPKSDYLDQMLFDLIIHGWDLAKSTGQDDDQIDPELVEVAYDWFKKNEEELRGFGVLGEEIVVSDDKDMQTKLLALIGRER